MSTHDIVIIGAGIGGLTTALALQQRGLRPRVFEQAAAPGARYLARHGTLVNFAAYARTDEWTGEGWSQAALPTKCSHSSATSGPRHRPPAARGPSSPWRTR